MSVSGEGETPIISVGDQRGPRVQASGSTTWSAMSRSFRLLLLLASRRRANPRSLVQLVQRHQDAESRTARWIHDVVTTPQLRRLAGPSFGRVLVISDSETNQRECCLSRPLLGALGDAAAAAGRTKNTYFGVYYKRLAKRRGPKRAMMAVMHKIITAVWHMLTHDVPYQDLGPDHWHDYPRQTQRRKRRLIRELADLGVDISSLTVAV